jgi:uncharacterized protein
MENAFRPVPPLKNPLVQTVLASSRLRTLGSNPMLDHTREIILTTRENVRLVAHYSPQPQQPQKGVVIMLNGWQGDSNSAYMQSTGKYLYNSGYAVFRLNYRDHGKSHHLNEGLFYATLLDEVFEGVEQAAQTENGVPVFLAGFSLGGNFALRIAKRCAASPIKNLRHIVSISPALDPDKSTDAIDDSKLIRAYFLKKWKRSLTAKQNAFPKLYDFDGILKENNLRVMTDMLIGRYTQYENAKHYFSSYAVRPDDISAIPVPTTIITAEDDPIIPVADFRELKPNGHTRIVIHANGGHNGFVENFRLKTWYEREMVRLFDSMI